MKDREFDNWLKERLESIEPAYTPEAWTELSQAMDDATLDEGLRNALDAYEAPTDLSGWAALSNALDHPDLDHQIIDTLTHLAIPYSPEAWTSMEQAMDDADFDNFVTDGLETHPTEADPAGWALLSSSLDYLDIDTKIESSLSDAETEYDPTSWNDLVDKLNVLDNEDLVRETLKKYEADGLQSDWTMMAAILDEKDKQRRDLFYLKIIEFILVALAIFILVKMLPESYPTPKPASPAVEIPIATDGILPLEKPVENRNFIKEKMGQQKQAPLNENSKPLQTTEDAMSSGLATTDHTMNSSSHSSENIMIPSEWSESIVPNGEGTIRESIGSSSIERKNIRPLVMIESNSFDGNYHQSQAPNTLAVGKQEADNTYALEFISTADPKLLDLRLPAENIGMGFIPKGKISLSTALDYNTVQTPYSEITENSSSDSHIGGSAKLGIAWDLGNWEVETGLGYSRKSYVPNQLIYVVTGNERDGYVAETVNEFSFNILSVPLSFRYYYLNAPKWKLYATGGASLNVVANSNYNTAQYQLRGNNQLSSYPRNEEQTNNGLFNGDSFANNYYVNAIIGMGVERKINNRFSAFAQPTFTYHIVPSTNGLGPKDDRFNSFSLEMGMRWSF